MIRSLLLALATFALTAGGIQAQEVAAGFPAGAAIDFTKAFAPATIGPGSVSTLTFTITNYFQEPVGGLAFTDPLPAGMTIASPARASTTCGFGSNLDAPDGGTTISFSEGALGASSECTVTVDVQATSTATNTSGPLSSDFGTFGAAEATLTVDASRPGFSKSFAPATVLLGGRSTLTITIDNSANDGGERFADFTDVLPEGMVIATPANAATDCGSESIRTFTAQQGTNSVSLNVQGSDFGGFRAVDAGASCTVTVDVVTTAIGALGNTSGELTTINGFNQESSGKASAVLTSLSGGALQLTKSFLDNPVHPSGDTTRLRFTIQNNSRDASASGLTFTDDLDAALPGLVATGLPTSACGGTLSGTDVLTLSGGGLGPEGSCTFDVTLDVPSGTPGIYTNTTSDISGTVGGVATVGAPASADLFLAPFPLLTAEFTDDPVGAGGPVTLEFTLTNTDPAQMATDLAFAMELTRHLPFPVTVTPSSSSDVCGPSSSFDLIGHQVELSGGNLYGGASCTFSVVVDIPVGFPGGIFPFTTTAPTGTVGGTAVEGRPASAELEVVPAPTLQMAFTDDPVLPGDPATLEFTISHDELAPGAATGIGFTLDLDAAVAGLAAIGTPISDVCGAGSQLAGTSPLTLTGGTLAQGDACTFSVTLLTPASEIGTFPVETSTLTATVDGIGVEGPEASDDLTVTPLRFTMSFIDDPVSPSGGDVTLRYTLQNVSPDLDATSISFSHQLANTLPGITIGTLPPTPCEASTFFKSGGLFFIGGASVLASTTCEFDIPLTIPAAAAGEYSSVTSDLSATIAGGGVVHDPAADPLQVADAPSLIFSKAFSPEIILAGEVSTLTFTIDNRRNATAPTGLAFTDVLPAGLVVAPAENASTSCTGGTLTAAAGTDTIELSGAGVAARQTCTVSVDVTAASVGVYVNTSGPLESSFDPIPTGAGPSATLTVEDFSLVGTKTDAFLHDGDSDGLVDGGDSIRYTVVLTAAPGESPNGVTFTDTPDAFTSLVVGSVTTTQGTVTTGNGGSDTEVAVAVGALTPGAPVTITFDVVVDDPIAESVGPICNQGRVDSEDVRGSLTDDPDVAGAQDPTCTQADQPAIDLVITSISAERGGFFEAFGTLKNTTDISLGFKVFVFLKPPTGQSSWLPARRGQLEAGKMVGPARLVEPQPFPSNAEAGTYTGFVRVKITRVPGQPELEIVQEEPFEFTLGPQSSLTSDERPVLRPGAGPNPFTRSTTVRFPLEASAEVDLRVFDVAGRQVAVLLQGQLAEGVHEAVFEGGDRPAGVYLWRLTVDGEVTTGAVTLVR